MRLPFLGLGASLPSAIVPLPKAIAAQSQEALAAWQPPGTVPSRAIARQDQTATARSRSKAIAAQDQLARGRGRSRALAAQDQRATATGSLTANLWPNGYQFQHEIRLRAWGAGTGSVANFLLPFAGVSDAFKTIANGGEVQASDGKDIRFETTGGTKLGHVLVSYDGTAGRIIALVNMPRNFAAAESVFAYLGKPGMMSSEESAADARAGGWLAWFRGFSLTDRTGQGRNFTESTFPPQTSLLGWPAYGFDGAGHFVGQSDSSWANGVSAISCVSLAQAAATNELRELYNISVGTAGELGLRYKGSDGRLVAIAKFGASVFNYESANGSQSTEPQAVAYVAAAGSPIRMAINGEMDTPSSPSGSPTGTLSISDTLEWGKGGRGSIGSWNGPGAFLALRSGAMSNAEMESMTAALVDPRLVYGVGEANLVNVPNRSPVALPVFATAEAGTPKNINVTGSAYDANSDALTVTDVSVAKGSATATVPNASDVRLTGNTGLTQDVILDFGLRDGGNKRSRGRVYAEVKGADLSPELPTPLRTLTVGNSSELTDALGGSSSLGPLQPGDQINLAGTVANQTTYGGTFTISRNGTAPTNANRNGVPIVITAQNILGARMTGSFNLNGTNVWLRGIDFDRQNGTGNGVSMSAPHTRLLRCRFRRFRTPVGKAGDMTVTYQNRFQKIWYCEFMDWDGRCISGKTTNGGVAYPSYPHIAYCHAHDNAFPPAGPDYGNGREWLQLGQTQGGTGADCRVNLGALVEYIRIERCYLPLGDGGGTRPQGTYHDENEPISIKASDNIVRYVTFGPAMGGLINNRFGNRNEISSSYIASGQGIGVYGDDNLILYNRLLSGMRIQIYAGTQWMDLGTTGENADAQAAMGIVDGVQRRVWVAPQANPTARRTIAAGNNGLLRIGQVAGTTAGKPIYQTKNNVVRGHTGTIQTQASYGFSTVVAALREEDTTNPSGVPADLVRPLGTEVTAAMVGPLAPWTPPAVWPPTL